MVLIALAQLQLTSVSGAATVILSYIWTTILQCTLELLLKNVCKLLLLQYATARLLVRASYCRTMSPILHLLDLLPIHSQAQFKLLILTLKPYMA